MAFIDNNIIARRAAVYYTSLKPNKNLENYC